MIAKITEKWNDYLSMFHPSQKDIYYYEEYVKLYETQDNKALCAICTEGDLILLMPFIRREINGFYDFETAYGYGGPITNTEDANWITIALNAMQYLFQEENYVCGFIRFHPMLDNAQFCNGHMTTLFDRNTVAMDTRKSESEIWSDQIISKNRNMIRKAEKNGLVYKAEYDFSSLDEFVELYNATMKRLKAEDFYFFDRKYYKTFVASFKNQAFLGTVRKDGQLICAALFMYSAEYGHYHLEGSNHAYSNFGANNYLLWKTALELKTLGIKEFHLGGGYDANPDNSLLKFKKAFNNHFKNFYIGKWMFNPVKYTELRDIWIANNPNKVEKFGNLLLCYRY